MTQLSDRYARALLDGRSDSEIKVILRDLENFKAIINDLPDLNRIMCNPLLSRSQFKSLMAHVMQTIKPSKHVIHFINTLIDNGRLNHLLPFIGSIKSYVNKKYNKQIAIVYSASKLGKQETDLLKQKLQQHLNTDITIDNKLDASILSGIRIQCGTLYVDGTLNKQIDQIKQSLKGALYANENR